MRIKARRRTEFVTVRSSRFKIETMERKKEIAYRLELFDINGQSVIYPYPNRRNVEETDGQMALQNESAGKQGRALVCGLMEHVCSPTNLRKAYKQVKQNKGSCGMDGMQVDELGDWIKRHGTDLVGQLKTGTYQPQAVRLVEIPKPDGGTRRLGIQTVTDRHPAGDKSGTDVGIRIGVQRKQLWISSPP